MSAVVPRDVDIVTLVRAGLERGGDSPLLIFEDGLQVSNSEFLGLLDAATARLGAEVKPGDRVVLMMDNRTEYFLGWLAVVACGGTVVSLNPRAGSADAAHILADSEARLAIVGPEQAATFRAFAGDGIRVIELDGPEPGGLGGPATGLPAEPPARAVDDITNVFYTSGSTGSPKGCMVDSAYWLRIVAGFVESHEQLADDRLLCCLPFFYNDPSWQLLASIHLGTPLVVMRRFSKSRFWRLVVSERVTKLFTIASIPAMLLTNEPTEEERAHNVRFAVHVGVPADLHHVLVERFGIPWLEVYGLTETGGLTAVPLAEAEAAVGTGTIGPPRSDVDLRIVDESGGPVATGSVGEVIARHGGMFRGYLNRPEATSEAMRDGYFHTGDLARMDERGWLFFAGRKKDVVRRNGENISAAEVEAVLRAHPAIVEAAVLPVPDTMRGEEVEAEVQLEDPEQTVEPAEVVAWCVEHLAPHKIPRYVRIRTQPFPMTPSMRVAKPALRDDPARAATPAWDREAEGEATKSMPAVPDPPR